MTRQRIFTIVTIFLFAALGLNAQNTKTNSYEPFETAEIYFEQNSTDGDAEIVFKVKAGDDGMTKLMVVALDGRTVINFEAPNPSTMGIRQFHMESPEPGKIKMIKKAYPEGIYKFSGTSTKGTEFMGEAVLSHILPDAITIQHPVNEAENVSTTGLEVKWAPIEGA